MVSLLAVTVWAAAPLTVRVSQNSSLAALDEKRQRVRNDNRQLRQEIAKLKSDEEHWETLARRQMGYIRSDEEAYVVIEKAAEPVEQETVERAPGGIWETLAEHVKEFSLMF